jgi:hypothetical protein
MSNNAVVSSSVEEDVTFLFLFLSKTSNAFESKYIF